MDNSSVVTHTIYDRVTSPISSFHTFPPGLLIQSFIMFLISSQSRLITLAPLSRRSCSPPKKFSFSASTTVRILYRIQVAEHMMQGERVVNIAQSLNNPSGTRPKFSRQSISPCRTLDESWTRLLCPREMMREVGRWTKAAPMGIPPSERLFKACSWATLIK